MLEKFKKLAHLLSGTSAGYTVSGESNIAFVINSFPHCVTVSC